MTPFDLRLSVARRIAEKNFTTLESINAQGGHLYLRSGAKLVVNHNSGGKFKCHIVSFCYDFSDLNDCVGPNLISKAELAGA